MCFGVFGIFPAFASLHQFIYCNLFKNHPALRTITKLVSNERKERLQRIMTSGYNTFVRLMRILHYMTLSVMLLEYRQTNSSAYWTVNLGKVSTREKRCQQREPRPDIDHTTQTLGPSERVHACKSSNVLITRRRPSKYHLSIREGRSMTRQH
jgi:hypothetical protein